VVKQAPPVKKQRTTPKLLNASGFSRWDRQRVARARKKDVKAKEAQGLNPARAEHLKEICGMYFQPRGEQLLP
jgi:hypothetical protein